MDLFLLAAVRSVCKGLSCSRRLCAAAAFGAVCTVILFIYPLPRPLYMLVSGLFVPAAMILLAFKRETVKRGIYYFITLYIMAFLSGGILTSVFEQFTFSNNSVSLNYHGIYKKTKNILYAAVFIAAMAVFAMTVRFFSCRARAEKRIVTAVLLIHGQKVVLRALVDTGNSLYEPVSHRPVMVAERASIAGYFKNEDVCSVRAVPYRSVGRKSGILYALPVDSMEIAELHVRCAPVFVAICDGIIGDGCQALLHPDMLR